MLASRLSSKISFFFRSFSSLASSLDFGYALAMSFGCMNLKDEVSLSDGIRFTLVLANLCLSGDGPPDCGLYFIGLYS
jgi:hypothetical protein